jgi:aminomethyltransferase
MAKHTPLYDRHRQLGGKMVEFGGFDLPVQYSSIREEHAAVRETAGLFDVSHMGQIHLRGAGAISAADTLFTRRLTDLAVGRVRYGLLCNRDGGVIDDVTSYRLAEDDLMFCVNASNVEKDHQWIAAHCADSSASVEVENASDTTGMLALQGPASTEILEAISSPAVQKMRRFRCETMEVAGRTVRVSKTGYTGAGGFELYTEATDVEAVFVALLEQGRPLGLQPAGLGARDTLRLEAALPLYGHELDEHTTPFEAGLGKFVDLDGRAFVGAAALQTASTRAVTRQLVGFVMEGRGIARAEYPVASRGETIGVVTSGSPSPTLGKSIGLAYVPPDYGAIGSRFDVVMRGRPVPALVVETPFLDKS